MKRFLPALLALALVGCNLPDPQEAARLKTENETLQAQVQTLTGERDAAVRERDDLRSRLQAIKDALENLPTGSTSAPATPTQVTPPAPETTPAPDSSAVPVTPSTPETPVTPDPNAMPETTPTTPDPNATPALPPVTAAPDTPALEQLKKYADDVLTAAQNFKAQTRQEAPSNCLNGYAAGAYNVQKSLELKECSIVAEQNGDYRVTARDAAGNSVSLP